MGAKTESDAAILAAKSVGVAVSCVTSQPFRVSAKSPALQRYAASFLPLNRSVSLASRSGGPGVRLRASHELTVIRPEPRVAWFEAIVTGYNVAILDPAEGELLAYHWHQGGTSNVRSPHLHIAFGGSLIDARLASKTLSRLHLPTGPVASGAIVRFLIEDLGIEPIRKHWRQTLERDEDSIA